MWQNWQSSISVFWRQNSYSRILYVKSVQNTEVPYWLAALSWWSSRETGAHWWSSGRAVWPVPEYLLWSASCLSRRVASHLAALTALWRAATAWWTLVEKSLTQRGDKWTGTLACWPRSADTCGWPGASEHEGRHRRCLSIPSTPDFWWLNGPTLASPSWSVELPCGS